MSSKTFTNLPSAVQRRTVATLMLVQVFTGLGTGASLTVGTGLVINAGFSEVVAGFAPTTATLGAGLAGIPLARLAIRRGRRVALGVGIAISLLGTLVVVLGARFDSLPLILLGMAGLGVSTAVQLQSRFAATDLAEPGRQSRDLSLVVWSTTIGAVLGPNLVVPGEQLGLVLGMPVLTGVFAFTAAAMVIAAVVLLVWLRPDPLLLARELRQRAGGDLPLETGSLRNSADQRQPSIVHLHAPRTIVVQRTLIAMLAISQAVMVSVMAMTPVHLGHLGHGMGIVGFTISLHIAGMFAFAPLFGLAADRFGRRAVIALGIAQYVVAGVLTGFFSDQLVAIEVGLFLLGTGWSAVSVASSALLTQSTLPAMRPKRQGQSDAIMSLSGAVAAVFAGSLYAIGGFGLQSAIAELASVVLIVLTLVLLRLLPRPAQPRG